MLGAAASERRAMQLMTLAAALHEAGHCIVGAALGVPLARAVARGGKGETAPDSDKAALLAERHRRRHPDLPPPSRAVKVALEAALMAWSAGGELGVQLRMAARPRAPWQPFAWHYAAMSRGDRRAWYDAAERLRGLGIHANAAAPHICNWAEGVLARHRETLWRLARLLFHHGRLTGVELDRLLAPVATDPEPRAKLFELAHLLATSPEFVWPVPRAGERPSGAGGATYPLGD
jgi:hypothetical protein